MALRVGTSGWYYDDWAGRVYPPGLSADARLAFYARSFATVEVNSTFYRDPSPRTVEGWIQRTSALARFEFSVKAPRELTEVAMGGAPVTHVAQRAASWRSLVLDPLANAARLGAVLVQLAPRVRHASAALDRLDAALAALAPHACAVEFRDASWLDGTQRLKEDAVRLLDRHDAAAVLLDGPSMPPVEAGSASHAYVRFHGRNADLWARTQEDVDADPDEERMNRYDYAYDAAELRPWASRLADLAREKRVVRVYFNNHPGGHAFLDARAFEALIKDLAAPLEQVRSPQTRLD